MAADRDKDTVEQNLRKQMGLQAQVKKFLVAGVVVVLLRFHAGIGQVLDGHGEAELLGLAPDGFGQSKNAECLRELVEDPVFARLAAG